MTRLVNSDQSDCDPFFVAMQTLCMYMQKKQNCKCKLYLHFAFDSLTMDFRLFVPWLKYSSFLNENLTK